MKSTIAEDAPWLKTNYTKKWMIGMKRQGYVLGLKSYASSANYLAIISIQKVKVWY